MENNHPNWLSYCSEGLKPPTSIDAGSTYGLAIWIGWNFLDWESSWFSTAGWKSHGIHICGSPQQNLGTSTVRAISSTQSGVKAFRHLGQLTIVEHGKQGMRPRNHDVGWSKLAWYCRSWLGTFFAYGILRLFWGQTWWWMEWVA